MSSAPSVAELGSCRYLFALKMSRYKTSRVNRHGIERRLYMKVRSPRIFCFFCLRHLRSAGKLFLIGALLGGAIWGVRFGMREFFVENEEFVLRHLDLDTNGELDADHFIEVSGITPGSSVFALNLRDMEERLLGRPSVENVRLSRRLPGTLRVTIEEREPVAWLECRPLGIIGKHPLTGILLDKDGVCFPCESWWRERAMNLPVVLVSQVQEGDITIGKEIRHHQAKKALALLRLSKENLGETEWSLSVVAVRNDYSLEAATNTGVMATFGMEDHEEQLRNLVILMDATARKGESIFTVNLIPKRNIPVIPELVGGPRWPRSRLHRDMEALLRP
ncbi:MAG TPA: hypothetical protein DIV39_05185 [Verrucomicrobiales bacterium]|nr:hypothetical protein [Verrucomicrobiales bacterium]